MKSKILKCSFILIIFILMCSVLFNYKNDKIKVAEVTHSIFYAPQYVALSEGYFNEEGLDVEIVLTPGADKVTAALISKDVDIGLAGSEANIYVYNNNQKDYLMTFSQLTQKDGSFILSRKKINNFSIKDLKGKTIIAGRKGGMPEMTLEWLLKENNIDVKKDLNFNTNISFSAMESSFISGLGDFVTVFEPSASKLEKNGYGYIVASLGELGGVVPYTSYSARKNYIIENKNTIKKFDKAIQKGLDFVNNKSSKEIAKSISKYFKENTLEEIENVVDKYKKEKVWPNSTKFTKDSFEHLLEIMENSNQLKKKVSYKDIVYNE